MRTNEIKARMREGKPALGVGLGLGSPLAAEILSVAGFDFALVDCQHGNWDDTSAMLALRGLGMGKAVSIVRVQQNDFYAIGGALDRGALGIVVPMVNSIEEAREAVRAARYPPVGERSMGPFATRFLGSDYTLQANEQILLMIQIESEVATQRAEELLAVEGVDGCLVGPVDLSLSMSLDLETPAGRRAHEAAIMGVLAACRNTGKFPGIAVRPADARYWLDKGFLFLTVASDLSFLIDGSTQLLGALRA